MSEGISLDVFILLIIVVIAIFILLVITSFQVYFSDTTPAELQIYSVIRNKDTPQYIENPEINVEPSKKINLTITVQVNAHKIQEAKVEIEQYIEKLNNSPIQNKSFEILCIFPADSPLIKRFDELKVSIPNCRYFISQNDVIENFKLSVLYAKGNYVINSKFMDQELFDFQNYEKQFIVLATPMNSVSLPFYNKICYSIPIFIYKPAGMIIFSRLHSTGQKATPEIDLLSRKCSLTIYNKVYIFSDFNPSLFYSIYSSIWLKVINVLYKLQVWTVGKKKRKYN